MSSTRQHYSQCLKCRNRTMESVYSISSSTLRCWNAVYVRKRCCCTPAEWGHFEHSL